MNVIFWKFFPSQNRNILHFLNNCYGGIEKDTIGKC